MRKTYLLGRSRLFFCLMVLVFASCNSNESAPVTGDTVVANDKTEAKPAQAQLAPMAGFLNILWIDSSEFVRVTRTAKRKLTFKFFLRDSETLTLHGWSNDSSSTGYDTPPDIKLNIGGKSAEEFGSENYLGNLVLYNKNIRKIINKLRSEKAKYVLFVPLDPAANNGTILYDIRVTSINPGSLSLKDISSFAPTGEQTNPSPPRNGNLE